MVNASFLFLEENIPYFRKVGIIVNMASFLLMDMVKTKIEKIKMKHRAYVFSKEQLDPAHFSIDYSRVSLNRPSKYCYVYYCREAVSCFQSILDSLDEFINSREMIDTLLENLDTLVSGWGAGKEVTSFNITTARNVIDRCMKSIRDQIDQYDHNCAEFEKYNNDPDGMIDRFTLNYFRPVNDIAYKSIYGRFYKKKRIPVKALVDLMEERIKALDHLIELMDQLARGSDVSGKGDVFEEYRQRQAQLCNIIQSTADLIEYELTSIEKLLEARKIIINVKIYPE